MRRQSALGVLLGALWSGVALTACAPATTSSPPATMPDAQARATCESKAAARDQPHWRQDIDADGPWSIETARAAAVALNDGVRVAAAIDECAYALVEDAVQEDDPLAHACRLNFRAQLDETFVALRRRRLDVERAVSSGDVEAARHAYVVCEILIQRMQYLMGANQGCVGAGPDAKKGLVPVPQPPGVFSWPPPEPTALKALPLAGVVGSAATLGRAAEQLQQALDRAGSIEHAFFPLPDGGFAIVTRPQPFGDDGKPSEDPLAERNIPSYLSYEYWRRLLRGHVGRYRVWLIAVTGEAVFSGKNVPASTIQHWASRGMPILPVSIANRPLNPTWHCLVFLYELYQPSAETEAQVLTSGATQSSGLSLQQHLTGAGLTFTPPPAGQGG